MPKPQVLIIGDICVDRYWVVGGTGRFSPEAPEVPVYGVEGHFDLPGMAGNVERNCQNLGCDTWLPTVEYPQMPVKNRLVTPEGQQLARWDESDWCQESAVPWAPAARAVVVCDYGKGAVTARVIEEIRRLYVPRYVPILVDTKDDPQRFAGCWAWFFPNRQEHEYWRAQYDALPSVVLKRGDQGMEFRVYGKPVETVAAHQVPAASVCGAGDTVVAAAAAVLARQPYAEPSIVLGIANLAAAVAVQHPFTYAPTVRELWRAGHVLLG